MLQLHPRPGALPATEQPPCWWLLWVAAAGPPGLIASVLGSLEGDRVAGLASALATTAAILLLVAAASWRRLVEPRARASTAAHVVPLALMTSAVGLALGHADDLGGWLGVTVAAAAVAWMAARERSVSRPVGVLSLLTVVAAPVWSTLAGPLWLLAAGLGLAFGRSTIAR